MNIDDDFLQEVGLGDTPESEKPALISRIRSELESRIGEEMGKDLSLDQLKEFEALMNNDQNTIKKLVSQMEADFREDTLYQSLLEKHGVSEGNWEILGEYLSIIWIRENRPDYRDVVKRVSEDFKNQIKQKNVDFLQG